MDHVVFISHSLAWGDDLLIAQLCGQLRSHHGLVCDIARRNWEFGAAIVPDLEDEIRSTDCVLAIVMNDGTANRDVIQEVSVARVLGKPVIGIAEKSAYLSPLLEKIPDLVVVDLGSPRIIAGELYSRLATLGNARRVTAALFWVLIATLGEIFASREAASTEPCLNERITQGGRSRQQVH